MSKMNSPIVALVFSIFLYLTAGTSSAYAQNSCARSGFNGSNPIFYIDKACVAAKKAAEARRKATARRRAAARRAAQQKKRAAKPTVAKKPQAKKRAAQNRRTTSRSARKRSPKIREIQRRLSRKGYRPGPADGLMGPNTRKAILKYYRDKKLSKRTQGTIIDTVLADLKGTLPASAPASSVSVASFKMAPNGSTKIFAIQKQLASKGYDVGKANGKMNSTTRKSIIKYTKANKISGYGTTIDKVYAHSSGLPMPTAPKMAPKAKLKTASFKPAPVKVKTAKKSTTFKIAPKGNDKTFSIQKKLAGMGYNVGTPNGKMNAATRKAIFTYSKTNKLSGYGTTIDKVHAHANGLPMPTKPVRAKSKVANKSASTKKTGFLSRTYSYLTGSASKPKVITPKLPSMPKVSAPKMKVASLSPPTTNVKSQNSAYTTKITKLQKLLKKDGYDVETNGRLTGKTRTAVKEYADFNGLKKGKGTTIGRVLGHLSGGKVASAKPKLPKIKVSKVSAPKIKVASLSPQTTQVKSQKSAYTTKITRLQKLLKKDGYDVETNGRLTGKTRTAVKEYADLNGLKKGKGTTINRVLGHLSGDKMSTKKAVKAPKSAPKVKKAKTKVASLKTPPVKPVRKKKAASAKLAKLQKLLSAKGYQTGGTDGRMNADTRSAITAYSIKHRLNKYPGTKVDKTLGHLQGKSLDKKSSKKVKKSAGNPKVMEVQGLLNKVGYSVGKPDGVLNKASRSRIVEYYKIRNLQSGKGTVLDKVLKDLKKLTGQS